MKGDLDSVEEEETSTDEIAFIDLYLGNEGWLKEMLREFRQQDALYLHHRCWQGDPDHGREK
jgi:hypothetical protein